MVMSSCQGRTKCLTIFEREIEFVLNKTLSELFGICYGIFMEFLANFQGKNVCGWKLDNLIEFSLHCFLLSTTPNDSTFSCTDMIFAYFIPLKSISIFRLAFLKQTFHLAKDCRFFGQIHNICRETFPCLFFIVGGLLLHKTEYQRT